jgi:hypothetical protein
VVLLLLAMVAITVVKYERLRMQDQPIRRRRPFSL